MRALLLTALLTGIGAGLGAGCTADQAFDEFEAEDTDESRSDSAAVEYTYYTVLRDVRRCAPPACGGYWVNRVNRAKTTCADGTKAEACYAAELDFAPTHLDLVQCASLTADLPSSLGIDPEPANLLVRGQWAEADGSGTPAVLVVEEAWAGLGVIDGPLVRARGLDIQCISAPCDNIEERKLNSSVTAMIAEVDLGAIVDERDHESLVEASGTTDGIIISGRRYSVPPASKGRRVAAAYRRVTPGQTAP